MTGRVELGFHPAAIEVERRPPSPAGRAVLWCVVGVFVLAIAWATTSRIDIVAVAEGRIIPSGHSKTVQPLEIGTVVAVRVVEGERVDAGQALVELDRTDAQADVRRLSVEQEAVVREAARWRSLLTWLADDGDATPGSGDMVDDPVVLGQWREYRDRVAVLETQREQQLAERRSAQQQVAKLEAVLPIVTRRATDSKALADQKLLPEQQFLAVEQERLELFHDLRSARDSVAEREAAVHALDARIALASSEYRRQLVERVDDAARRSRLVEQELLKANARLAARALVAPVAGTVQQLAIHNVGAVVTPAQPLMVIVPRDAVLEVEAVVENKDIGFLHVGQPAEVKVDAFPFTRFGTVAGEVTSIANDAVVDERKGLVYAIRVSLQQTEIDVGDRNVKLAPGMTVHVEPKTGTRRLIEYFLDPLLRAAREGLRER